ncbi:MAG TPA: YbjN domain-containing protein [Chloroflexia bacterium]|nr:YbjN domain-containing protein [Chloroflexia bacterium]
MTLHSAHAHPDNPITFGRAQQELIRLELVDLEMIEQDGRPAECRATLLADWEVYRQLEEAALFNLTEEVRGPVFGNTLQAGKAVEVEIGLNAALLPAITSRGQTAEEVASYLLSCPLGDELRQAENWYALNVKQADGGVKVGFQTVWAGDKSPVRLEAGAATLLAAALHFFKTDEWPVTLLNDKVIKITYKGDNGQWDCYAETDEESGHFAFYSVSPLVARPEQRPAAAEFLTRANYGLKLGNFEMDFRDGEIRYRTSIITDNPGLDPSLFKHLVHSNVMVMDAYLPGLEALLLKNVPAEEAIGLSE